MKNILKKLFVRKSEEEVLNIPPQKSILDSLKESIEKLSDQEKVEVKEYLDISLKEYEIARLEKELMYADDIERVKIKRKLNNLLDRDNLEDYEH